MPPEFEDDGTDKAKLKEFKPRESYPVHCPLFPLVKEERWFVLLGFPQNDVCITGPIEVQTLKDEETIELQFQSPPRAGEYVFNLYVFSGALCAALCVPSVSKHASCGLHAMRLSELRCGRLFCAHGCGAKSE